MLKFVKIILVTTLIFCSSQVVALNLQNEKNVVVEQFELSFSDVKIYEENNFCFVDLVGENGFIYKSSEPMLPLINKEFTLPFGTKIKHIDIEVQNTKKIHLEYKIIPAPKPKIRNNDYQSNEIKFDKNTYASHIYPENWFNFISAGGLDKNGNHCTFLNIKIYPVRYLPNSNEIIFAKNIKLKVTYQVPEEPILKNENKYDLVIITPSKFLSRLEKLKDHKNEIGINTTIKTVEEIYEEYQGVDKPEQIKKYIKDAIEKMDIKYVLLVGGMKSLLWGTSRDDQNQGSKDWYLPVRYSNIIDDYKLYDPGFISDLYYADIYDSEGNFSSWDSNEDGVFGNWTDFYGRDIIDLYPDIYLGRLPCRNEIEVEIVVNKIINYESNPSKSWYDKIIAVGGDPHDENLTNFAEGELICDKALSYMKDFEKVKIYASNKGEKDNLTPLTRNIVREVSKGCGHLLLDGHASPYSWNTGWLDSPDEFIKNGGLSIFSMPFLNNKEKLPVVVIGGCHAGLFNVTLFSTLTRKSYTWTYGMPTPECWAWQLTRKIGGGSIATIATTALGYEAEGDYCYDIDGDGVNEPDCVEALGGYIERCFYESCNESINILGMLWGNTINRYLDVYPGMNHQWDAKIVESWTLLGDPSLKIG